MKERTKEREKKKERKMEGNEVVKKNSKSVRLATHVISIERPDSWDDYCVSNALTLFRGTKI